MNSLSLLLIFRCAVSSIVVFCICIFLRCRWHTLSKLTQVTDLIDALFHLPIYSGLNVDIFGHETKNGIRFHLLRIVEVSSVLNVLF